MQGTNGNSRLDRIERALEALTNSDLKLSDGLQSLAGSMAQLMDVVMATNKRVDGVEERFAVGHEQLSLRQRQLEEHLAASNEQLSQRQRQLEGAHERISEQHSEIAGTVRRIADQLNRLADAQISFAEHLEELAELDEQTDQILRGLAETQSRSDERFEERFTRLAEWQERIDGSLNALIGIVDELIRKRPPQ